LKVKGGAKTNKDSATHQKSPLKKGTKEKATAKQQSPAKKQKSPAKKARTPTKNQQSPTKKQHSQTKKPSPSKQEAQIPLLQDKQGV
jgi:hypothetical protein